MMKKVFKAAMWIMLVLYVLLMLYELFFMRLGFSSAREAAQKFGYWEAVRSHTNLIPFLTIKEFIQGTLEWGIPSIPFMNLAGNVVLFAPIGVFLPYFREKQRKFGQFFLTVVLMIVCVELIQIVTLVGSCDIDDLILNVLGACIGFGFYQIAERMLRHEKRTADQ